MAASLEFIKLNGTAVRLTSSYLRQVPQDDGPPLQEIELVVILRGTMAHRSFLALLGRGQVQVEIPETNGSDGWTGYDTEIVTAYTTSSGTGEAAAHRHDILLRETPASAERRAVAQPAPAPATPAKPAPEPVAPVEEEGDPYAPVDLSAVKLGGNVSAWATALRQMKTPDAKPAPPPEPPLETSELAGAEAILVGLRLEALIEQLTAAGIVRRSSVDASFARLVQQRFVSEATPVIGEKAARRAARAAMEE